MTKQEFLHDVTNNDLNHRILLWNALLLTEGKVVEFGSGHGSTPYLRKFCSEMKREFESYDSNKEWAEKMGSTLINDWEKLNIENVDLLFLDHAPGERRKFDLVKYKDIAKIIVIHDTEPTGAGDYQVRQHFDKFKYKQEVKSIQHLEGAGCWATILSNHIDLSILIGEGNEIFKIE